ncbi:MAG TPA: hypothetical protein VKZ79_20940 [Alphaproteobacteria bacterium]|nr:hypothetical protein [Alphaproteobacteria bacterium]
MRRFSIAPILSFQDAMSVHVLRAHGAIYSELTRLFGANPARFHEILTGALYPGSWEAAVERLARGDVWHPAIAQLVERYGRAQVLTTVKGSNPTKRRFQKELKRLRKTSLVYNLS